MELKSAELPYMLKLQEKNAKAGWEKEWRGGFKCLAILTNIQQTDAREVPKTIIILMSE